jgi:hypothetical protein
MKRAFVGGRIVNFLWRSHKKFTIRRLKGKTQAGILKKENGESIIKERWRE